MAQFLRHLVSKKKRRFKDDHYDLDLAYIGETRLIAMGYPSEKFEGIYRNPYSECLKFLDDRHNGKYLVVNLCIEKERQYPLTYFHGRVRKYQFKDHNAPPFSLMEPFCEEVHKWLEADKDNHVVVHCKAGKGRTGVMICTYLVWSGYSPTTEHALALYGAYRTYDKKGVTIASQRRYVCYFDEYCKNGRDEKYPEAKKKLKRLEMPILPKHGITPYIKIRTQQETVVFSSKDDKVQSWKGSDRGAAIPFDGAVVLQGDYRIDVYTHSAVGSDDRMFAIWINTRFLASNELALEKGDIDKACKDKKHKVFPPDFRIRLVFEDAEESAARTPGTREESERDLHGVEEDRDLTDDEDDLEVAHEDLQKAVRKFSVSGQQLRPVAGDDGAAAGEEGSSSSGGGGGSGAVRKPVGQIRADTGARAPPKQLKRPDP